MENQKTITMEFKGTKEEWELNTNQEPIEVHHKGKPICMVAIKDFYNKDIEGRANAKLISAAPDLLKALKSIIDPLTGLVYDNVAKCIGSEQSEEIENAIQKALS